MEFIQVDKCIWFFCRSLPLYYPETLHFPPSLCLTMIRHQKSRSVRAFSRISLHSTHKMDLFVLNHFKWAIGFGLGEFWSDSPKLTVRCRVLIFWPSDLDRRQKHVARCKSLTRGLFVPVLQRRNPAHMDGGVACWDPCQFCFHPRERRARARPVWERRVGS